MTNIEDQFSDPAKAPTTEELNLIFEKAQALPEANITHHELPQKVREDVIVESHRVCKEEVHFMSKVIYSNGLEV